MVVQNITEDLINNYCFGFNNRITYNAMFQRELDFLHFFTVTMVTIFMLVISVMIMRYRVSVLSPSVNKNDLYA